MGWTWFNFHGTTQEFIDKEFYDKSYGEVIDHSRKGNVLYMAYKINSGKYVGKVTALVYLLGSDKKSYYNFGYKSMEESVGPVESDCPKRILDKLSPVEELYDEDSLSIQWAREWRQRCLSKFGHKKTPPLRAGDMIELTDPIKFTNGGEYKFFKKIATNRWKPYVLDKDNQLVESYFTVRFRLGMQREYKIIQHETQNKKQEQPV
jgi:hypothetical protein